MCGDGNPEEGEQCDDGNATSGDGCSDTCQVECPGGEVNKDGICQQYLQCMDSPYRLPWPAGLSKKVNQDELTDTGSHESWDYYSAYAIDFGHTFGDDIVAIESGTVVKVVSKYVDYTDGGCSKVYGNKTNMVSIKHLNGETGSIYLHLKNGSIKVEEGDNVSRGDVIASAGYTGYTCGDHLHYTMIDASTYESGGYGKSIHSVFGDESVCNTNYQGNPKYYARNADGTKDTSIRPLYKSDNY